MYISICIYIIYVWVYLFVASINSLLKNQQLFFFRQVKPFNEHFNLPSVSSLSTISTLRIKNFSLSRYSPTLGPVTETEALLEFGLQSNISPSKRKTRRSVKRLPLANFPRVSSVKKNIIFLFKFNY